PILCGVLARKLLETLWIARKQAQQLRHRLADQDFSRLIFLKRTRAAAENLTRLALRELETQADGAHFIRFQHALHFCLKLSARAIGCRQVDSDMHAIAALLR